MVRKLVIVTEEKFAGTEWILPVYRKEFATRGMSFEFANAAWLQYLERKLDYFGVPSPGAQDELLKNYRSPAALVGDQGEAPPAASTVADDVKDDNNWDLEGTAELDDIEKVDAKRRFHEFQDSGNAKKHEVLGTDADAFEFATKLLNQEALAETGLSTELVSIKDSLPTAQSNGCQRIDSFISKEARLVEK